jgi:pimeloyl-ACP methyl ester carboxylesterase
VHHLGIDEPRLVAFAQRLAERGVEVFTPELPDLKNYELSERALTGLREAVDHFEQELGARQPGLMGLSFAGGLALVAASDPALGARLSYVASIGGHHDLSRVLRFFISNRVEAPTGTTTQQAHDYGLVLLTYTHLSRLVPQRDVATLRAAFRTWLAEDRVAARALAAERASLEAEHVWLLLEEQRLNELSSALERAVADEGPRLSALSPRGKLAAVRVPVFVLHGRGDTVIPASEAEWTELELQEARGDAWSGPSPLGSGWVLITPLLDHVSLTQPAHRLDELRLLGFWAQLL